ncbi:hypothetical protein SAMN05518668_11651 [Sphingobium sp. YR657]|nr:hypothetical protein A0U87_20080 [Sphingobium sp. MP9-4]SHM66979.1 hypothetical protein SAMN05518668_11651 [Sphingobium sp. YR657]
MMPARAEQPGMRREIMGCSAMKRVKWVDVDDRVNRRAVIGQAQNFLSIGSCNAVAVDQNEASVALAHERGLRADVEYLGDLERATDVPEILVKLLHL